MKLQTPIMRKSVWTSILLVLFAALVVLYCLHKS